MKRLELALTIAEECIQPNELRMLLEKKPERGVLRRFEEPKDDAHHSRRG